MSWKTRLLSARTCLTCVSRAVSSDPAAKETRAVAQTIHPWNFQRSHAEWVGLWFVFIRLFSFVVQKPLKAATCLFGETPNAKGNRQPDHNHVHTQPKKHIVKFVRASGVKRGERQNDIAHYQFNRNAIEQAAHQRVLLQKGQPAACRVVNCRG